MTSTPACTVKNYELEKCYGCQQYWSASLDIDSGLTIFNVGNNYEQYGQQNIVLFCYEQRDCKLCMHQMISEMIFEIVLMGDGWCCTEEKRRLLNKSL